MTLCQILKEFTDKEILKRLFQLYPDQKKSKDGYANTLNELRHKRAKKDSMMINVNYYKGPFDDEEYVSIDGFDPDDITTGWAIEFQPWSSWLGMEILPYSLENFSKLDIMAYCLWEMTWSGYSCKQVRSKYRNIMGRYKEAVKDIAGVA